MKLEKVENDYRVLTETNKQIGYFILDIDGSYYWWQADGLNGAWTSHSLREIATLLDEVNKPFDDIVDEYFIQERRDFENRAKIEYRKLKSESGLLPLLYVHLTGEWKKDRIEWLEIFEDLEKKQVKTKW